MIKTYVLLDSLDLDVPIFQQVNGGRVQLKKLVNWQPTLRQTFQDKDGISKTIRYKENSNYLFQDEQIEKEKLLANISWTTRERNDRIFRNGTLTTNKPNLQNYLENHPAYDKFEGFCDDYPVPAYKLLDEAAETKIKNSEMRLRIKAAQKVLDLDLEGKQALLIRLNGSFFEVPGDPLDCENILMEAVDEADEKGLEEILRNETNLDEDVSVLIGKLLSANVLSFDAIPNQVAKQTNGKWIELKQVSSEYTPEERKRYFSEFLTSDAGKLLLADLKKELQPKKEPETGAKTTDPSLKENTTGTNEGNDGNTVKSAGNGSSDGDNMNALNLRLAEEELKEAKESKAHHKTIEKLERKVAELKAIVNS